jgi:hypothetical protein
MLGTYWMWMTGGIPTMTGGPDHFTVNMGSTVIHLALQLTGFPDTLTTSLSLTDLFGGTSSAPTFDGTFANAATTGLYVTADFPSGVNGIVDFTIKLGNGTNIASLGVGQHMSGPISSGELVPSVPEPGTLALMGTGVLSLAGLIRRKIK